MHRLQYLSCPQFSRRFHSLYPDPTMGEEWRRVWHPEKVPLVKSRERTLVVGAGPAGLEAARGIGEQGHKVMLAEAGRELGGRVSLESRLPGLAECARVRDWCLGQIDKLSNVEIFRESEMMAALIAEVKPDRPSLE